jgi:hypothetical protein
MASTRTAPSVDPTPAELLQYLAHFKVVVCSPCQYAVQPSAISRHLKDIHHIHRGRRRPYMQYASSLDLQEAEDVIRTKINVFPVPYLPVQNGLRCRYEGCSHLCVTAKRMKSHWTSVHGKPGEPITNWQPVPLQTFFRGNLLRYFTKTNADLSLPDTTSHELRTITQDVEHQPNLLPLDESDIMLLKHYISCTCICRNMITNLDMLRMWQVMVPRLARFHPFLMHGVLACSALHLSYQNPTRQREYMVKAAVHQDIAMPLYREAIANRNDDNCHAIFAFSHLIVIYSFATEKQDEQLFLVEANTLNSLDILPNWLYFLRSGCSTLCGFWEQLEVGPVKQLVEMWEIPDNDLDDEGRHVTDYLISVIPRSDSRQVWSDEEVLLYQEATIELGRAFSSARDISKFTTWDALRIWPMKISDEYISMVYRWHPGALIILGHYCILLQKIETHWYFEGRATRLLSSVLKCLDEEWHRYLRWPMEEIGISQPVW